MPPRLTLRVATAHDLPDLHQLAHRAVHQLLGGHHYTATQVRAATAAKIYEVEPDLVTGGTYYVAEINDVVVAGSGWSGGGPLQPDRGDRTDHRVDNATAAMRATYVDPRWARHGLATLLARLTETAATIAGTGASKRCAPPRARRCVAPWATDSSNASEPCLPRASP